MLLSTIILFGSNNSANATAEWTGVAVLVVDVQKCFIEGGSLAVPGANQAYVKSVEKSVRFAKSHGALILGSRDYHPEGHVSFASNHPGSAIGDVIVLPNGVSQKLWPNHCVQTTGDSRAMIDNNLFFELIKKGDDPNVDSPSAFKDDLARMTELNDILKRQSIKTLIVFGLATDVCVKQTVMDALTLKYKVAFVEDLSRGITHEGVVSTISEMKSRGVDILKDENEMRRFLLREGGKIRQGS